MYCTDKFGGTYDAKDYASALRAVQRYLSGKGLKRRERNGTVRINPDHIAWRNMYFLPQVGNCVLPLHL